MLHGACCMNVWETVQVHIRWGAGLLPQQPDGASAEQQDENGSRREGGGQQEEQQDAAAAEKKQKKAETGLRPYCTVAAGPAACVSRPADSGRDAQWRETSFLYIRYSENRLKFLNPSVCRHLSAGVCLHNPSHVQCLAGSSQHASSGGEPSAVLLGCSDVRRSHWYTYACMQGCGHAAGGEGV